MSTSTVQPIDLDAALVRTATTLERMLALSVARAKAGEATFGPELEAAMGDVVRELRGTADLLARVLGEAEPVAFDEPSPFSPAALLASEDFERVPGTKLLRLVPRRNATVCDDCGLPYREGEWPYCASKVNPEGHQRGAYGFVMRG